MSWVGIRLCTSQNPIQLTLGVGIITILMHELKCLCVLNALLYVTCINCAVVHFNCKTFKVACIIAAAHVFGVMYYKAN